MINSEHLIASVHPALSTDPEIESVIGITFSGDGAIEINESRLLVALDSTMAPIELQLSSYTIAGLVAALPASLGAAVLQSEWSSVAAAALIPVSRRVYAAGEYVQLGAYTAGLWRVMRPIAAGMINLSQAINDLIRQIDIRLASGPWLDLWGEVWNIPRAAGESDSAYRNRIIYTITLPRVNNRALEALILRALGRQAVVADGSIGGMFQLNKAGSSWWPTGGAGVLGPQAHGSFVVIVNDDSDADVSNVVALVQQYKAAGTSFAVSTSYAPTGVVGANLIIGTWE